MRLVYKFYIRHTDELDKLFRTSNNLYNQALYLFRQRLDADGVWTWYNDMDKLMKGVTNLEGECNYAKAAGMPIAFRHGMRAAVILSFGLQCIL